MDLEHEISVVLRVDDRARRRPLEEPAVDADATPIVHLCSHLLPGDVVDVAEDEIRHAVPLSASAP